MSIDVKDLEISTFRHLSCDDLVQVLSSAGFTEDGVQAVSSNELSGEWFVEFDENDIKDLFTEFRDRFLARKILTKYRNYVTATTTETVKHQNGIIYGTTEHRKRSLIQTIENLAKRARHSAARENCVYESSPGDNGIDFSIDEHNTHDQENEYINTGDTEAQCSGDDDDIIYSTAGGIDFEDLDAMSDSPALPVGEQSDNIFNADDAEDIFSGGPVFLDPCPYAFPDLLERKPKFGSATPATHYFLAVLRQSATECGLWSNAPFIKEITPDKRADFMAAMSKRLPGIHNYEGEVFKRLSMALQNRRKYRKERLLLKTRGGHGSMNIGETD